MINNDFYEHLEDKWYTASDHPIAILRAENKVRVPWVQDEIKKRIAGSASVLDVGCGAGFLTNPLALQGHTVTGIDISSSSLDIAKKYDKTKKVKYIHADAYNLPF